MTDYQESTMLG